MPDHKGDNKREKRKEVCCRCQEKGKNERETSNLKRERERETSVPPCVLAARRDARRGPCCCRSRRGQLVAGGVCRGGVAVERERMQQRGGELTKEKEGRGFSERGLLLPSCMCPRWDLRHLAVISGPGEGGHGFGVRTGLSR